MMWKFIVLLSIRALNEKVISFLVWVMQAIKFSELNNHFEEQLLVSITAMLFAAQSGLEPSISGYAGTYSLLVGG